MGDKMLSRIDIENELGKGINIVPFNRENIKENSINLSASEYAWSLNGGSYYINNKGIACTYNRINPFILDKIY